MWRLVVEAFLLAAAGTAGAVIVSEVVDAAKKRRKSKDKKTKTVRCTCCDGKGEKEAP